MALKVTEKQRKNNDTKVFNFDTFDGDDIRKVYAKLQWRYCREISWLQYQWFCKNDFVGHFLWFLRMLLVWPPQSWLDNVNVFRQLVFVEILLTSSRRKFETNEGNPSVDSARKVRKQGYLHPGNAIFGQSCKIQGLQTGVFVGKPQVSRK